MKTVLAVLAVIIILAGGGYAIAKHNKNNKSTPATSSSTSSSSSSKPKSQTPAVNNAVLITKTSSSVGSYLADPSGKALYTYGADSNGVSNCTGSCLSTWPAYVDNGATTGLPTNVGTIKRSDDGKTQFTYKGMPLYTFASDSQGRVTGDGVNNFHAAKP